MKKFLGYLNTAFTGAVMAVIAFLLQFFWWLTSPNHMVSIWLLYLVVILMLGVVAVAYAAIRFLCERNAMSKKIKVVHCDVVDGRIVLLAEAHPLLEYGIAVSIYKQDAITDISSRLAVGYVENTTVSGKIQIAALKFDESFKKAIAGKKISQKELYIKPSVDRECF